MRIAVIADDFTGAAELGAVALRYGLSAEVTNRPEGDSAGDVLALNTDSRSLPPREAAIAAGEAAASIRRAAQWAYKKTDSVLRGPIVAEVSAVLSALGLARALLVAPNPSLGRVIRDGCYYVHGTPLHQTGFATDSEYPATTSDVLKLLGPGRLPVTLLVPGQPLPEQGIAVGQAASEDDLRTLAGQVDEQTLAAGGAEFFAAVLAARGHALANPPQPPRQEGAMLVVCGSAPPYALKTIEQARAHGVAVLPIPQEVPAAQPASPAAMQTWADEAADALARSGAAVVSIGTGSDRGGSATELTAHLAEVAGAVLSRAKPPRVCVEGGATAAAVARRMGWRRFVVAGELAPGVVCLRVVGGGPMLTMKPGSYPWPASIWP